MPAGETSGTGLDRIRLHIQDYLYQREFEDTLKAGVLKSLHVAFSRDQVRLGHRFSEV